jgi:hypothetical protein
MKGLTVTPAALKLIQECLERNPSVRDPVVALVEMSETLPMNREWGRAFQAGADEKTLRELLLKHHRGDIAKLRTRLVPEVHARDEYLEQSFLDVCGIALHLSAAEIAKMAGWTLDASESGLVLKDATGAVVRPKPLMTLGNL